MVENDFREVWWGEEDLTEDVMFLVTPCYHICQSGLFKSFDEQAKI